MMFSLWNWLKKWRPSHVSTSTKLLAHIDKVVQEDMLFYQSLAQMRAVRAKSVDTTVRWVFHEVFASYDAIYSARAAHVNTDHDRDLSLSALPELAARTYLHIACAHMLKSIIHMPKVELTPHHHYMDTSLLLIELPVWGFIINVEGHGLRLYGKEIKALSFAAASANPEHGEPDRLNHSPTEWRGLSLLAYDDKFNACPVLDLTISKKLTVYESLAEALDKYACMCKNNADGYCYRADDLSSLLQQLSYFVETMLGYFFYVHEHLVSIKDDQGKFIYSKGALRFLRKCTWHNPIPFKNEGNTKHGTSVLNPYDQPHFYFLDNIEWWMRTPNYNYFRHDALPGIPINGWYYPRRCASQRKTPDDYPYAVAKYTPRGCRKRRLRLRDFKLYLMFEYKTDESDSSDPRLKYRYYPYTFKLDESWDVETGYLRIRDRVSKYYDPLEDEYTNYLAKRVPQIQEELSCTHEEARVIANRELRIKRSVLEGDTKQTTLHTATDNPLPQEKKDQRVHVLAREAQVRKAVTAELNKIQAHAPAKAKAKAKANALGKAKVHATDKTKASSPASAKAMAKATTKVKAKRKTNTSMGTSKPLRKRAAKRVRAATSKAAPRRATHALHSRAAKAAVAAVLPKGVSAAELNEMREAAIMRVSTKERELRISTNSQLADQHMDKLLKSRRVLRALNKEPELAPKIIAPPVQRSRAQKSGSALEKQVLLGPQKLLRRKKNEALPHEYCKFLTKADGRFSRRAEVLSMPMVTAKQMSRHRANLRRAKEICQRDLF